MGGVKEKNVEEIREEVRQAITFHYVADINSALKIAGEIESSVPHHFFKIKDVLL